MSQEGEFIPNLPRFESEEQELRWILNELHKDYQKKIQPIVKRLQKIDAARPLPPVNTGSVDQMNMQQIRELLARYRK
ncbi:hypothetical protein [Caballeronia sp. TF1N1]|uniref:hypothetical protein n=1 Tax=Caballeronia sp. TF1N1 TaxID=2878153 RepID=UPI001FD18EA1|nr:hypothetical protein [Caballeronia sp. TF1N1]